MDAHSSAGVRYNNLKWWENVGRNHGSVGRSVGREILVFSRRVCGVNRVVVNLGPKGNPTHARTALDLWLNFDDEIILVGRDDAHGDAVSVSRGLESDVVAPGGVFAHGFDVCVVVFGDVWGVFLGGASQLVDDYGSALGVTLLVAEELVRNGAELTVSVSSDNFLA